ncbi:MAG: GTP-binding protein [Verrucomicrobiales bacterium]
MAIKIIANIFAFFFFPLARKKMQNTNFSPGEHKGSHRRFALIGGFLGAGKTTAVGAFANALLDAGMRPALITNDQGEGLIDSQAAAASGAPMKEITGGCFCCRADALGAALAELDEESRPDVFLAEPVGSCTDLVATVLLPLREIFAEPVTIAPMAVVVDSIRLWDHYFGPARGRGFSKEVRYIYEKQLEEAEIIALNKVDLLSEAKLAKLEKRLAAGYPGREVIPVSARNGDGMKRWFLAMMGKSSSPADVIDLDYARYGAGEALLGWYNARISAEAKAGGIDANRVALELASGIQRILEDSHAEIAHLKVSIGGGGGFAVANAVRNGNGASLSRRAAERHESAVEILINVRAECDPDLIADGVGIAIGSVREALALALDWRGESAFKPGQPNPTYRVGSVAS